ncbi:hypothetical protein LMG22037_03893 [Paraburkholderia phenoliruptrix]|uniref:Uncharacterized protein n=1 Tax=Paraburkholderia phenoliruptrix TaxID=252970 RepID=A0A6J5BJJ9_9BURK|nr:hypothetical protein [Paraburkholderia phenoliruptrix]CAB3708111.1 hypothetical protein LMG22037_03893 [Paraburkholderia phenoliruptrix]
MSTVEADVSIPVMTSYRRYSREYRTVVNFTIRKASMGTDGWLEEMLRSISARSLIQPYGTSAMNLLHKAIELGQSDSRVQKIFAAPSKEIRRSDLFEMFEAVEWCAKRTELADTVQKRAIGELRARVISFGETAGLFLEQVTPSTMRVRRQKPQRSKPRPIISDLVQEDGNYNERAPISALTHETIKDLEEKALRRIDADSERIIEACISDLTFWDEIRTDLNRLARAKLDLPERTVIAFDRLTSHVHVSNWVFREVAQVSSEDCISAYLQQIEIKKLATPQKAGTFIFSAAKDPLRKLYPALEKHIERSARNVLFLLNRIHTDELAAAFLLLMFYTGWNMNGVVNLTSDRISKTDDGYEIQGFKSKTDDDTPFVYIDKTHRYGIKALELVLWNLAQLKQLGRVEENETRIWFGYSNSESEPYTHQYVGFQGILPRFCESHGIAPFSFDQIRTQVLMGHFLSTRDPERARQVAGHKTIATTGVYLDQEFAKRLNSANNLEFQRRFEATVKFKLEKDGRYRGPAPDTKFVDSNLMIPVGDGTTCANPAEPPDPSYLAGEFCDGKRCHVDGECRNQRIVLNEARLNELALKRRYYRDSWQRLLQANPDAFHAFHVPSMFFTFALYVYVKEGPYGHVLNHIEREIAND